MHRAIRCWEPFASGRFEVLQLLVIPVPASFTSCRNCPFVCNILNSFIFAKSYTKPYVFTCSHFMNMYNVEQQRVKRTSYGCLSAHVSGERDG